MNGHRRGYTACMNRPITSRMHAMLDYPLGVVLILAPWIFGFSDVGGAATAVPIVIGALAIAQSLMTDWELSLADVIPLPAHLMVDVVAGIVLAISPFIFGFSDEGANAWIPHVVVGLGLIAAGLMTQRVRSTPRSGHGKAPTGARSA
jgi:hypothetical protein